MTKPKPVEIKQTAASRARISMVGQASTLAIRNKPVAIPSTVRQTKQPLHSQTVKARPSILEKHHQGLHGPGTIKPSLKNQPVKSQPSALEKSRPSIGNTQAIAAKRAREEAAERGRIASRAWAEKKRAAAAARRSGVEKTNPAPEIAT